MSNMRRLIKNACVITMDPKLGTLDRADILIEREQISAVAPDIPAEDCEVIDGAAMIAIPGFVDTHRHVWMSVLRGMGADYTLFDYVAKGIMAADPFARPEDVYNGTYAGVLEALDCGVTTLVDHGDIIISPEHADEAIRAYKEIGMRAVFCYGMSPISDIKDGVPNISEGMDTQPQEWRFEDALRVRETLLSSDKGRLRFGIAMSEVEIAPIESARKEIEFARELGAHLIGFDAACGPFSGDAHFVHNLANAGLLGPDMLVIHGNSLTNEEIDLIAKANAAITFAPENELQTGLGFPPYGRALKRGARVGIGVDTVSGYRGDLFTQMRFALQVERFRQSEKLAQKELAPRSNKITARDVLELATMGGARAANLDGEVGSLTPGKQADVVLIRTDSIALSPVIDPVNTVVVQANAPDVDTVFLAGKPVKRGGKLLNVDLPLVLDRLAASRDHILEGYSKYDNTAVTEFMASIIPVG